MVFYAAFIKLLKESVFPLVWSKNTSSDPGNWSCKNPAWGQCAVTSAVLKDYIDKIGYDFENKLVWAEIDSKGDVFSHYFNRIDGVEYDLTLIQMPVNTLVPKGVDKLKGFNSTYDYVMSYAKTVERYEILKKRTDELLELILSA